jgi:hypothetical protein
VAGARDPFGRGRAGKLIELIIIVELQLLIFELLEQLQLIVIVELLELQLLELQLIGLERRVNDIGIGGISKGFGQR